MRVLITGASGFIGGYLVSEFLRRGHFVTGLDNFSKYGRIARPHDAHPRYKGVEGDAKDVGLMRALIEDCDHFVAGAAMIGGITYFNQYAYDLLAENERITASAFDAAIYAHKVHRLKKITVMSSSMVFESAQRFPTPEGEERSCAPPKSTYGFQKLSCEYFARGAFSQHGLPYTIIRPFNCVGIGEVRASGSKEIFSGSIRLAMSHVLPDLVQKAVKGQDPIHILGDGSQVRHYTYGGDLAVGICDSLDCPGAVNEDFNLSTDTRTTVLELAKMVWDRVNVGKCFRYVSDPPLKDDVKTRSPDTRKSRAVLGFNAKTGLDAVLEEVIPWVREQVSSSRL